MRLFCSTLIGRAEERSVLDSAVQAAQRGRGGTVFVAGEPGIGKSRLAAEAQQLAQARGLRILRGRATPSAPQFRPLTEALFSVLRHADQAAHPDLGPFRPALSRLVPEWRMERPAGQDDSVVVLAEAVVRLLASLGDGRGCLMLLEDLQDADEDTVAVAEYLTDNLAGLPVLLVATVRSEQSSGYALAQAAAARRSATLLELPRLADSEVRELVAGCLSADPGDVPPGALTRLLGAADGIPFHVEELLAGLADGGSLVRDGERWLDGQPASGQVPATVRASVAARVGRLGPRGRDLLQAAAILGRQFPASIAAAVAGIGPRELLAEIRAAVDAQLLTPGWDADSYSFRHALTAEALRSALLPAERADLARRAAEAIEQAHPDVPDSWAPLAATLWREAGNVERAAQLYCAAGRRALAQGAVATATGLLEDGRALAPTGSAAALDLTEALLDALVVAGEIERATELGGDLRDRSDRERTAAVRLRLARAAVASGHWAEGLREIGR
ncbi:MAG: LuxR family transcriptional regulator, partial [Actinomycetia bacterium]|nr:LuxR family transcriptional regulator [Actinomycetes bacterium]